MKTPNKNKAVLKSFTEYCKKYPEQRFWQALRNWSDHSFVFVSDAEDIVHHPQLKDTYYWSGKKAKEST